MELSLFKKPSLALEFALVLSLSISVNAIAGAEQLSHNELRHNFSSDVIGMSEQQLTMDHWLNKLVNGHKLLMTQNEINKQNKRLITNNVFVNDPFAMPNTLSKQALVKLIDSISKIPNGDRFYYDGSKLNGQNYQEYLASLNKHAIKAQNKVEFALVVKRASLRTFPTSDKVYKKGGGRDLDRFQESGVFPGDAVAVLHHSADSHWLLVQVYNYLAWLPKNSVAIGDKQVIKAYKNSAEFLMVTGSKIFTNFVPQQPQISNLQIDMGSRLPLAKRSEYANQVYGQNTYANYIVKLPIRDKKGKLNIILAPIPRSQDVHRGYLAYTKANIIKQAFKFLGERYGWGHDFNGRDCTGFVGEVYKTFGFNMPRNSGDQGHSAYGINHRFEKTVKTASKMSVINQLQTGDFIYIPGHVMMVLGMENNKPYIIHDVHGLGYLQANGDFYRGVLNGVSVTPLLPLRVSKSVSYIDSIYNIKRIALMNE
ncbi:MAG: SH3 domain-containing protein [Alteromonadaceae bacterium]|nr:SH3 domain-containing protein [Alteromonadaceae bacterium]